MNKVERLIYDLVKSNPKIKKGLRNIYQGFFDLLPRKKQFSLDTIIYKEGFFYGFHDTQPFSNDNTKLLALKYPYNEIKMPSKNDFAEVGYIEFNGEKLGNYISLSKTNAWNFHKGCRLQWVNDEEIIFNCTVDGKLVSKIVNITSRQERIIPYPIDTVSPNGLFATSFSYERLEKHMPGYGYLHSESDSYLDEKTTTKTGLYLINLEDLRRELLVDLKSLSDLTSQKESSIDWDHYVTHTEFSHDSKLISFFHRWSGEYKGKRFTEFMLYDLENKILKRLPTTNLMTSHYVWNNNREIIAYCNYNNQDAHVLFKIDHLDKTHFVAYPQINSDGHQSFASNTSFVTDTYPDKWRMAKLWYVDIITNQKKLIASVFSSKKFQSSPIKGHVACDLHPIVSNDGKYVCFDTVHSGKRSIAIMSLKKI